MEEFLKYAGYGVLPLRGYIIFGIALELVSITLAFLHGVASFSCNALGEFARSTITKSAADEVQMGLISDAAKFGSQYVKNAPKLINKLGEVTLRGNEENLIRLASIEKAKDALTCGTIANEYAMTDHVAPMALQIAQLQRETLKSCTTGCAEKYGSIMVAELVTDYGRSAGSIAANVTNICGNCCKDHIVEVSTVVTQEFASEASTAGARWWIEEAAMEAGRKSSTTFMEILTS